MSGTTEHVSKTSAIIDLEKLERESMKFFYMGLIIGMFIIILTGQYKSYRKIEHAETSETEVRHITVDIISLPPSVENPYETWKRKPEKRSLLRKEFNPGIPVKDFLSLKKPDDFEFPAVFGIVETVSIEDFPEFSETMETLFPLPFGNGIEEEGIARIPDGQINIIDELINVDHFDTGQYKGFLIHDPYDKQNIKGYVHIPVGVRSINLKPNQYLTRAISDLAEGFYRYSGITLKMDGIVYLTSPQLLKYPFLYLTSDGMFDCSANEKKAMKNYFDSGGVAFMEAWRYSDPIFRNPDYDESVLEEISNTYGDDVSYISIPKDHDLNNIVFDHQISPASGLFRERRLFLIFNANCFHYYGRGWIEKNVDDLIAGINIVVYALMNSPKTKQLVDGSALPMKN